MPCRIRASAVQNPRAAGAARWGKTAISRPDRRAIVFPANPLYHARFILPEAAMPAPFRPYILSAALLLGAPAAHAIDCNRAQSVQEIAICGYPELKSADDALTRLYNGIRAELPGEYFAIVRSDQIAWIKARDADCGGDVRCLLEHTRERTKRLANFREAIPAVLGNAPATQAAAPRDSRPEPAQTPPAPVPAAGERVLNPQEIYRVAAQSSVVVLTYSQGKRISQGSGVALAEDILATNCHVVEEGDQFAVTYEGEVYEAALLIGDQEMDYCLLVTDGLPARQAEIAGVDSMSPGQRVYSVGSPQGFELTISEGLISGLRQMDENVHMIQTSAPISPGSSGGGLFNESGQLLGITTSGHKDAQNLNFAVPAEFAYVLMKKATEQLKQKHP